MNEKFSLIKECPALYLIEYFDEVKTKVDLYFETKNDPLLTKKRIKIIEIIENCLSKCIKNKLSNHVLSKTHNNLTHLESHLLANNSCTVINNMYILF